MTPLSDLDRGRVRTSLRLAGLGTLTGLVLALLTGLTGGSGRAGAAVALLVGAVSCGAGALHGVASLVLDDLRGKQPSGWRAVVVGALFVVTALLLSMVMGLGRG